jgi:hypothetical protein
MQKLDKKFKIIDHYDDYQRYLDPDKRSELSWFGYCLQCAAQPDIATQIELLTRVVAAQIAHLNAPNWIIKHDDKDFPWIQNEAIHNALLQQFKELLEGNGIAANEVGPLVVSQKELCTVLKELIYYPQNLSYKNIDLIPVGSEVVIKFTHHLDIQLISRNKVILEELLQFAKGVEGLTYMELKDEQTF